MLRVRSRTLIRLLSGNETEHGSASPGWLLKHVGLWSPPPHSSPPGGRKDQNVNWITLFIKEGTKINTILCSCCRPFFLSWLLLPLWLKPLCEVTRWSPIHRETNLRMNLCQEFPKHVKWTITPNLIQVGRYWLPFHTQWIPNKCRCVMGLEAV